MMAGESAADGQVDPILLPLLNATDDADAAALVERLIADQADGVITRVIKSRFHGRFGVGGAEAQDAADLRSDIIVRLLFRLRSYRVNPHAYAISSFRNYVAVTSYNACYESLREKYPKRHNLKSRLRYLLSHRADLALWEIEQLARHAGGELRVCTHCYAGYSWLPSIVEGLRRRYPAFILQVVPEYTRWIRLRPCSMRSSISRS